MFGLLWIGHRQAGKNTWRKLWWRLVMFLIETTNGKFSFQFCRSGKRKLQCHHDKRGRDRESFFVISVDLLMSCFVSTYLYLVQNVRERLGREYFVSFFVMDTAEGSSLPGWLVGGMRLLINYYSICVHISIHFFLIHS